MGWTEHDIPDLEGRTIVVTGANSGIGLEAADLFKEHGAHVVLACRNQDKGQRAVERLDKHPRGSTDLAPLDLASLESVREFAAWLLERHPQIDVLVNNAGVMALPYRKTQDGFEMQFGTNHLGHFALTALLMDRVRASAPARIVNVSSTVHRAGRIDFDNLQGERSYSRWGAYAQSKLANLLFTKELARRFSAAKARVVVASCHPGYASTNLQVGGARMTGSRLKEGFMTMANGLVAQSARMGAMPTVYAAVADRVEGGDFIGPRGLMKLVGYPTKERPARRAEDPDVARRLWEVSEELTGIELQL